MYTTERRKYPYETAKKMSSLPLQQAISNQQIDIVRSLLTRADPNPECSTHGTALGAATDADNLEIVKMIVNECVDVNESDQWGRTALGRAKSKEVREFLRKHGAK